MDFLFKVFKVDFDVIVKLLEIFIVLGSFDKL